MLNLSTYTQHNFHSPDPKMCHSHRAQLSKLWQSHELCSFLLFLSPFSLFFLLMHHTFRLSPSKTDQRRTRKKQTTTTEILHAVPISKISMTILTVGRRGQSERGKSLCPMNLHGWKSGRERERKREQSAVKAQLTEREGWRRAGTYRKTQEKNLKHRGERGWSRMVGEKWGGSGGREHVMRIKDTWEDAVLLKVRHTNGRVFLLWHHWVN